MMEAKPPTYKVCWFFPGLLGRLLHAHTVFCFGGWDNIPLVKDSLGDIVSWCLWPSVKSV